MTKYILYTLAALIVIAGLLETGYRHGWDAHSAKVNQDYKDRQAKLQRQQAKNTEKAAHADTVGEQKTEVIYRDVVKYIKTSTDVKCNFSTDRVHLKQRAVANANAIEGYDN